MNFDWGIVLQAVLSPSVLQHIPYPSMQEEIAILLEIQSTENVAQEMCEHCPIFGLLSSSVACKDEGV